MLKEDLHTEKETAAGGHSDLQQGAKSNSNDDYTREQRVGWERPSEANSRVDPEAGPGHPHCCETHEQAPSAASAVLGVCEPQLPIRGLQGGAKGYACCPEGTPDEGNNSQHTLREEAKQGPARDGGLHRLGQTSGGDGEAIRRSPHLGATAPTKHPVTRAARTRDGRKMQARVCASVENPRA
ncbi:unnamed protein product [Rangifer tarandus platyrhynchus]|uniref:Uncharacterized protein n=1 Tax=Rangifer tarandus platyrhynchus TaxID=3082113 RepID=A0AC59Z305_RANTA